MTGKVAALAGTLILAGSIGISSGTSAAEFHLRPTIAFSSTRDHVTDGLSPLLLGAEIYLAEVASGDSLTPTLVNLRRLTEDTDGDGFAKLSPTGKRIAFDSDRLTAGSTCGEAVYYNIDDLFVMDTDGNERTFLTRGSSGAWSPDGKRVAFHASSSYYASSGAVSGCPIRTDPGSAMSDSDIFIVDVDDRLSGLEQPVNITNTPDRVDDDPEWSTSPTSAPGGQTIVFTGHPITDDPRFSNQAELYLVNPDGTGVLQLTSNGYEERSPAWSPPDAETGISGRIVFMCRIGGGASDFEICVMNADGSGLVQLTDNSAFDGTPSFAPDGTRILFHRTVGAGASTSQQLFVMNADGTNQTQLTFGTTTSPEGVNNLAQWGEVRVKS
jgi:TolB protein